MGIKDYKTVLDLIQKGLTLEARETIMALREEHLSLREANLQLQEENNDLKKQLELEHQIQYEPPYYWKLVEGKKDGPYCQQCKDKDQKLIRLQNTGATGAWSCLSCEAFYTDDNYVEPTPQQAITNEYFQNMEFNLSVILGAICRPLWLCMPDPRRAN